MTTTPQSMEHPDINDRTLGVRPGSISSLPFPDAIVAGTYENRDDKLCCIRQIAEVTKTSLEEVSDLMDACEKAVYGTEGWSDKGATAKMIFEHARRTGRGARLLHGDRSIDTIPGKRATTSASATSKVAS